jgi:hypothetical protein
MATHDYSIANQSFPATRTDLNNALTAIKSSNSNSTAPSSSLVSGQLFYDTANNVLKVYNGSSFATMLAGEVTASDIATNAVGSSEIAADAVTASEIAANAVGASELSVTGNGTSGQILTSDADGTFSWASLTAGTGLDLTGTTFSVEADLRDVTHIGLDTTDYITWTNNSSTNFFVNGAERMRLEVDGDIHADGNIIAYSTTISDERLKTGISTVSNALEKVSQLNGVEFTRKNNGQRSAGVIAQQVEKVLPQAVIEKKLPLQTGEEDTVYKTVEYDALHSLYIEAIKELKGMVEKQSLQIKELQGA